MSVIHLDAAVLSALHDVMEAGYPMLVEVFLQDSEQRVARLQHLQRAARSEGLPAFLDEVGGSAHSFKGSCANMGAVELGELCRQLEDRSRAGDLTLSAFIGLLAAIEHEFHVVRRLFELEHSF